MIRQSFIAMYGINQPIRSTDRPSHKEIIGTGLFIRVGDLNADGRADIVVPGKTGTYILWQD